MIKLYKPWYLFEMVAQNTLRAYEVNEVFRFVEGIWLHRKSRQGRFFFGGKDLFCLICAQNVLSYHFV